MKSKDIDIHSVGGVIYNEKNEILIQYHNKYDVWTIPMGKVSDNKSINQTLIKEFKEELDIDIVEFKELTSETFIYNNINPKDWTLTNDGKSFKVMFHLFEVYDYNGTIKNNEPSKHAILKYAGFEEIKDISPKSDALKVLIEYRNKEQNIYE